MLFFFDLKPKTEKQNKPLAVYIADELIKNTQFKEHIPQTTKRKNVAHVLTLPNYSHVPEQGTNVSECCVLPLIASLWLPSWRGRGVNETLFSASEW